MESSFQIRVVRENLALAIALWAAARRGVITAAFVPGDTVFTDDSGDIVRVSSTLNLRDNRDLIRCTSNQIRGAFAFSAIQTHRALETVYSGAPLEEKDPDLRAARCIFFLLNRALSRSMLTPVWSCPPEYCSNFAVLPAKFFLDVPALEGKEVSWGDFGGLGCFLELLEYCSVKTAEAPPAWEKLVALDGPTEPSPVDATADSNISPLSRLLADRPPQERTGTTSHSSPLADPLEAFVAQCCSSGPDAMSLAKDLYEAYVIWCTEQQEEPLAQRSFGMALTAMGFERRRRGRGKHWWVGVGLLNKELAGRD